MTDAHQTGKRIALTETGMCPGGFISPSERYHLSIVTEISKVYGHANQTVVGNVAKVICQFASEELRADLYQTSQPVTQDYAELLQERLNAAVENTRHTVQQAAQEQRSCHRAVYGATFIAGQ